MNIRKIIQTIPIICGLSGLSDAASSIIMPKCSKSGPYKITTNSGYISRPYSGFGLNTIKIPGEYSLPDVKAIVDPCGNRIQPRNTELSSPLSSKTSIFSGRWDAGSIITFPNLPTRYSGKEVFFNNNKYKIVIINGVPAIKVKPSDKIKYTTGQYYIPSVGYTGTIAGIPNGGNVFSGENLPSCNPGTLCFSVNSSQELIVASEKKYLSAQDFVNEIIEEGKKSKKNLIYDWRNISFRAQGKLSGDNTKYNICGKYVYRIGNVIPEQKDLINGYSSSNLYVNPTGALWPTGESSSVASFSMDEVYKYSKLQNLKNSAKWQPKNNAEVVIHVMDTASNGMDNYKYVKTGPAEQKSVLTGHGKVIGDVINTISGYLGFRNIDVDYLNVCDENGCDDFEILERICLIAEQSNQDIERGNSSATRHIINMSFGSAEEQVMLRDAIVDALSSNVSIVLSYGNVSTCNNYYERSGIIPSDKNRCSQYPADYFNSTSFKGLWDKLSIRNGLNGKSLRGRPVSTKNDLIIDRGIYVVGSEYKGVFQEKVNRMGSEYRNAFMTLAAPAAFKMLGEELRVGTSFSAAYVSVGLGMWRSCDAKNQLGPSIFDPSWYSEIKSQNNISSTGLLDYYKMLVKVCK